MNHIVDRSPLTKLEDRLRSLRDVDNDNLLEMKPRRLQHSRNEVKVSVSRRCTKDYFCCSDFTSLSMGATRFLDRVEDDVVERDNDGWKTPELNFSLVVSASSFSLAAFS